MEAVVVAIALLVGIAYGAVATSLFYRRKRHIEQEHARALTHYLEQASLGYSDMLAQSGEGELYKLQDEIAKTVSALRNAQDEALVEKEEFAKNLANIAHQLKTPLTALSLSVQQLKRVHDPNTSKPIDDIEKDLNQLVRLQNDLLLMAKIDTGALKIERTHQDVYTLACIAADGLETLADDAGVSISIGDGNEESINADAHWTSEALSNVLKNCIEHSPRGATVHVSFVGNPLYVQLVIVDEGEGFSPETRSKIFDRFYTAQSNNAAATGLGLAFARELLELQGATIYADNHASGGAQFTVRFYRNS